MKALQPPDRRPLDGWAAVLATCGLLAVCGGGTGCSAERQAELAQLEADLAAAEKRAVALKASIAAAEKKVAEAKAKLGPLRQLADAAEIRWSDHLAAAAFVDDGLRSIGDRRIRLDATTLTLAQARHLLVEELAKPEHPKRNEALAYIVAIAESRLAPCRADDDERDPEDEEHLDELDGCDCADPEKIPGPEELCSEEAPWIPREPDWRCAVQAAHKPRRLVCAAGFDVRVRSGSAPQTEAESEAEDSSAARVRVAHLDRGRVRVADFPAPVLDPYITVDHELYAECVELGLGDYCLEYCDAMHGRCDCAEEEEENLEGPDERPDGYDDDTDSEVGLEGLEDLEESDPVVSEAQDRVREAEEQLAEAAHDLEHATCLSECRGDDEAGQVVDELAEDQLNERSSRTFTVGRELWPGILLVHEDVMYDGDLDGTFTWVFLPDLIAQSKRPKLEMPEELEELVLAFSGPDARCPGGDCHPDDAPRAEVFVLESSAPIQGAANARAASKVATDPTQDVPAAVVWLRRDAATNQPHVRLLRPKQGRGGARQTDQLDDEKACVELATRTNLPKKVVARCAKLSPPTVDAGPRPDRPEPAPRVVASPDRDGGRP